MQREDEEGTPEHRLKGWKKDVFEATTNDWLSTTEVWERLPSRRAKASNAMQQTRRTLRDLITDHDLLQSQDSEVFQGEMNWRRKPVLT